MNFTFVTRAIGAGKLALKAHGPTLMVIGGVTSMGAAVVTASQKTLKVDEVVTGPAIALEAIQDAVGQTTLGGDTYTAEDAQKDRYKVYVRTGWALSKHYAVPGALFIAGAGLVFGGHHIQLKRNAALALAFTTLADSFAKYRENTQNAMGPEFDRAMLKGFTTKEIVDEATGKVETVSVMDWDADSSDPYNRVFEQGESDRWEPDLGINKDFIAIQQKFAQERLNRQGHLYLSDVYTALGFAESPISRMVGWKVTRLPDGSRSIPTVDFGINNPLREDWTYSQEQAIYLDFNCQGLIIGGLPQKIMEQA